MSDSNDDFLNSLRVAEELKEDTPTKQDVQIARPATLADAAAELEKEASGGLSQLRQRGRRNVPFNHSVLKETAQGFTGMAIKHGWTMNATLTKAYELMKEADERGDL